MNTPSPNGDNGRDAGGRFAKGNAGGPGNPFARRVAHLRSVLLDAMTDADLAEVACGLVRAAKAGDVAAAKLLLTYTVGRPAEALNPDRMDVEETRGVMELAEAFGDLRLQAALHPKDVELAFTCCSNCALPPPP